MANCLSRMTARSHGDPTRKGLPQLALEHQQAHAEVERIAKGESDPCAKGHDFVSRGDGTARCADCHEQVDVSINTRVTLQLAADIPFASSQVVYVELFGIGNDVEGCRIEWSGFRCGDLSATESFSLTRGIVFGSSAIQSGNSVVISPDSELLGGITYVVHVFAHSVSYDFKTWWIFKT